MSVFRVGMRPSELSPYTHDHPLLLATDFPPNAGGGGAVIIRSLVDASDRECMVWASPRSGAQPESRTREISLEPGSRRLAQWLRRRSVTIDSIYASAIADQLVSNARRHGARGVWIVMHGAMVHVAARLLARHSTVPVHLSVHDDPPFAVSLLSRRRFALAPLVMRDLRYALEHARSIDVISGEMAARYQSLYGVKAAVVHRGLAGPVPRALRHDRTEGITIGVLGNTYGYTQVLRLAEATELAAARARVPGRIVVVGAGVGARLADDMRGRLSVEVTGHLEEIDAIEQLKRCFLLYLNYPFSGRARVLRRTSFPTKLSTYVLAGRPLLVHAPHDTSLAPLFEMPSYAVHWENMRVHSGANAICDAWGAATFHESKHEPAELVRRQFYDLETNRTTLWTLLNGLAEPPTQS